MPPHLSSSAARRAIAIAMAGAVLATPAQAADSGRTAFDARPGAHAGIPSAATKALRKALGEQGLVSTDGRTGTVRAAGRLDGALTGPSDREAADVALGYVREHGRALGLPGGDVPGARLARRAVVAGGMEVLTWRQSHRGIPAADTFLRAAVDDDGRLLSLTGAPAADLAVASIEPAIAAEDALAAVTGAPAPRGSRAGGGTERTTTFPGGGRASLALYQGDGGTRLAWRVLAPIADDEVADALVDASDGTVVKRANRVKSAEAKVFRANPEDTPTQATVEFAPWLHPGAAPSGGLKGPSVWAFADPADVVGSEPPATAPTTITEWTNALVTTFPGCGPSCTWDPSISGSWSQNRDQSATQLFYFVNTFLGHLAAPPIGFSQADGAFSGADPMIVQAMDGATNPEKRDNASFLAYPDGTPGLMEVHLFRNGLDGANDASLVFHEVTHGLTERLVTDAQGYGALSSVQASAIAEGTSDFYAMDYLVGANLETDVPVRFGEYLGDDLRTQPIDTAPGYTYGDVGEISTGGPEAHDDGEIWAQTLWELRGLLGVSTTRQVLTGALRIAPPEPSFLDLRNAMLIASGSEADDRKIWEVFARRGMGYLASSQGPDDADPVPDTQNPYAPVGRQPATLTGVVRDDDQRPVAGAHVLIGGHAVDGLGPFLGAVTDANGQYALQGLSGPHPLIVVRKAAHTEAQAHGLVLPTARDFELRRDWSSAAGGAKVASFTGPDNTANGCGPGGLIDDSGRTVWGSAIGGQSIVVDLGVPVDVAAIRIDPAAGCGDDDTASLGAADVQVATAPGAFVPLASPSFTSGDNGVLTPVSFDGERRAVRFVRLVAKAPQGSAADTSGARFVDVAELDVLKTPGSPIGPTADTGAATGIGPTAATLTGSVAPNGGAVPAVIFEYGTTTAYGGVVAAGGSPSVTATVSGLTPSRLYHYRVVALRDGRRYEGADATFVTAPAPEPPAPKFRTSGIASGKLVADRRGRFKVKVRFAFDAPTGTARLKVKAGRTTVAAGKVKVVRDAARTVALRLNAAGRRAVKPGGRRKVRVALRLPGGKTVAKTVKLTRRR